MSRMTLSDRIAIEAGIYARKNLTEIAKTIHKSRRHVSEEIRRNGTKHPVNIHTEKSAATPRDAGGRGCAKKPTAFVYAAPVWK